MKITELFSKLKQQRWLIAMVVAALTIALYFAAQKFLGPKLVVHSVEVQDVVQTVVASGHVETPLREGALMAVRDGEVLATRFVAMRS